MAIAFDANLGNVTNSASLTTSAAAAASTRVFLFVWWFDASGTLTGVSGGGLTWVVDHQFASSIDPGARIGIASADAPSGLASSTVITPSFSTAPDFGPGIAAASFTGVATGSSGYIDTTSTGKDDTEETWTTNNLATTLADTLLVAISAAPDGTSNTATGPATEIHDWTAEGTNRAATVYRIVSSAGTYTIGGVWSATVFNQFNIGVAYESGEPAPGVNPILPDFARAAFPFVPAHTDPWLPR